LISAAKCQLENELYDLTLPGFVSAHGEYIPRSDYLGISAQNARRNKEKYSLGFDKQEWADAYKKYSRFSVEELEKEISYLQTI
jgi:hypothetical protein